MSALLLPLTSAAPAQAATPNCIEDYYNPDTSWAMACSYPEEGIKGAMGTWRNVPIGFGGSIPSGTNVNVDNQMEVIPDVTKDSHSIILGLSADWLAAGPGIPGSARYQPHWTQQSPQGGATHVITQGRNPSAADNSNHTYMALLQPVGNEWDVLYDFNLVGTTDRMGASPRSTTSRIDIGLGVRGPEHVTVPNIANRMQYMPLTTGAWKRTSMAKVSSFSLGLNACGPTMPGPWCFATRLTGGTEFTQWSVAKPGATTPAPTPAPAPSALRGGQAAPAGGDRARFFNGVDQQALGKCLAEDGDCLSTVPGLTKCLQTVRQCNQAALDPSGTPQPTHTPAPRKEDFKNRAATLFAVPQATVRVKQATPSPSALSAGRELMSTTVPVVTVESSAPTKGLDKRGLTFEGFRATYSATTGELLSACWGEACKR
ncbi:hypothetical protein AB0D46_25005 [Streptomyces sp. NPDC048383]|uniref:hypothetical protein n=1 Tax=Streptomyces sp. NPDC048383 TaxID=3155386 RepID=UPI003421563B